MADAVADPREPCPRCRGQIRVGARKCPHCRAYLDPLLARDREMQVEQQIVHTVDAEVLERTVSQQCTITGVCALVLAPLGVFLGPICLGYALYYQNRARRLQLPEPRRLRLLFGFSGLWFATGLITCALFWYFVIRVGG